MAVLPGDPYVARRALLLGALAEGETHLRDVHCDELTAMIVALRALGVAIVDEGDDLKVTGRGLQGLKMASAPLDCGRSIDTLALLAGVLVGQPFGSRLLASVGHHVKLDHLVGALRARGAHIAGSARAEQALAPPLSIAPLLADEPLRGIECELPEPDAAAKTALLTSGLFSAAPTTVHEPLLSSDHTERMLSAMGLPLRRIGGAAGFDPAAWSGRLQALAPLQLPGDPTLGALIASVASVVPGSRVALREVGWNPARTGLFDALHLLGGRLLVIAKGDRAGSEPIAELQVGAGTPRGGTMGGELMMRCGEALPGLCLLGARSVRGIELLDGEVYAAPGDLIWERMANLLRAFGVQVEAHGASLSIAPAPRLLATHIDAHADARLAFTAVLCGLAAEGETVVQNADSWIADHPHALACLRTLGARVEVCA